jgi:hypothetical protein
MARKAYEQLNALEFERNEDRVRYICPPGQHDDLAMSLAMLGLGGRSSAFYASLGAAN